MRWQGGRRSTNVEDMRGSGGGKVVIGGGIGLLLLVGYVLLSGGDPSVILGSIANGGGSLSTDGGTWTPSPEEAQLADFVSVVLADTEDTWTTIFQQSGMTYVQPKLVLFSGGIDSACGYAQSATGPFYCPEDQKVYIDLAFYRELKDQYGAPGDFAQAYVIAHEVGHHVQNLLGTMDEVNRIESRSDEVTANRYSVMLELQADCYAGVWAKQTDQAQHILEAGDIEEALNAASQIGDDTLQRETQGYVVPDSFTHGTSAQRVRWFQAGFTGGTVGSCDTFHATVL
ncbi:MAG TPA: neutral zinc metallopeptidase [Methanomicrobiales archaeon]|nr:neutral zinc metallopeptidase [Methanomicrobiales archaeon]